MKCKWCGKEFEPLHHNSRYCSNECRKEARNKSKRDYYYAHPERIRATIRRYRKRNRDKVNAYHRKYYREHLEERRAYYRMYRSQHLEKYRTLGREYYYRRKFNLSLCGNLTDCLNCTKSDCIYDLEVES